MSRFEPVFLPEDRRLNGRVSQTFLRHYALCPRSGFFYALYKGEASTAEMQRGKAVHMIQERGIRAMLEQGEPMIPPDLLKVITNEILAEIPVPIEEHDVIREMAWRLGSELTIDPQAVVAVETLFVLEIGGYQVRCRVDFAEMREGGAVLYVEDMKSARGAPSWDEISRKRPDGSFMPRTLQLVLYALALVYGVPVREEEIDGERVETPEPFSVGSRAQRLELAFKFPAIEDSEGRILYRSTTLSRAELDEYRMSLEGLLARLAHSEESGDWPAVVSDAACSICPASSECPIPRELRDHRGTVNTAAEAAEAWALLDREKADHRARTAELRNFVKANGGYLRFDGKVAELVYSEYEKVDRDGLLAAVDRAVRYGEAFERSDFVQTRGTTRLDVRDVTADELVEESLERSIEAAEAAEGSNG